MEYKKGGWIPHQDYEDVPLPNINGTDNKINIWQKRLWIE